MDHKEAVYGVDVSKDHLCISQYGCETRTSVANGVEPITVWLSRIPEESIVAMEATGAYHQVLAALAHAADMRVFVLNPRALKHYAVAIGQRGKTDPIDGEMIARYAMHEKPKLIQWRPTLQTDRLSQLLQRRHRLVVAQKMLAQSLAGMSGLKAEREKLMASLKRMITNLELLMRAELARTPVLGALHRRLCTIVGVGFVVAAQLVAALTRHCFSGVDAFIAYTGLDPRPDDSGRRRGRRRLSKCGPALLRHHLYNGGMSACNSKLFKPLYLELRARGLQSTEAIVIVSRKLARIAFALYRSGEVFDATKHLKTT